MIQDGPSSTRRNFLLGTAALSSTLAIAGCSGGTGEEATSPTEAGTASPAGAESPTATESESPEPSEPATISMGTTREFSLRKGDGTDPQYSRLAKPVTFEGTGGETVLVAMSAGGFDSRLVLAGPDGTVVAENDDAATGLIRDSRILVTLPDDGEYPAWAGSYDGDGTGSFSLSLSRSPTVEFGSTTELTLETGAGIDPLGKLGQPIAFEGSSGEDALVAMSSDAFDPYLTVVGPDGDIVAANDDAADDAVQDSQLVTTLPADGRYTVWAGSFDGKGTGSFSLSLVRPESTEYGTQRRYDLDQDDWIDPVGGLSKPVRFSGSRSDRITVTMRSSDFDASVFLEAPDGEIVAFNNDRDSRTTNSELTTTLEQTGRYTVWASSFEGDSTGSFYLAVEDN